MLIEIHLGVRWLDEPVIIRTLTPARYAEFDPDDIFAALQRIGHPTDPDADHDRADIERIIANNPRPWSTALCVARRALDRRSAPSMSVGDRIVAYTAANEAGERTPIVEYVCESMGWTTKAPAPII